MPKNNKRVDLTRILLKTALLGLLENKSIGKITVKELCDTANISRSTFYANYYSIYALIDDIEQQILDDTDKIFQDYPEDLAVVKFLGYIRTNNAIMRPVLFNMTSHKFYDRFIQHCLGKNVDKLSKMSSLHDWPQADIGYYANYYTYGMLGLIKYWMQSNYTLPISKLTYYYNCLITKGGSLSSERPL